MEGKTVIQELIDFLDKKIKEGFIQDSPITTEMNQSPYKIMKRKANSLLEAEKKQICDAYIMGEIDEDLKASEQMPNFNSSEQYFSSTFPAKEN